jgi:hypothetical protein
MSPISNTKNWRYDQINGWIYLCHGSRSKHGLLPYQIGSDAQKRCTIIFPWRKNKYKRLPMGIKIALEVFQNVMSKLTQDLEYVKAYLDDLLILTNNNLKTT